MIPRQFEIGGHLIKVKRRKKVLDDSGEVIVGLYSPYQDTIYLATWHEGERLTEEAIEHNFYHELAHVYMTALNDWEFNANEAKIDMLGLMMAQYEKSKKDKI